MINAKTTLAELQSMNQNTLMEQLGIEYLEVKSGYVKARMPVNEKTRQPMGILHGGSSLALAETVGSLGSAFIVGLDQYDVRGSHMSANHVSAAKDGFVIAEAVIIHQGRNTHVWNIDIRDEAGKLVSTCRLTNFVIARNTKAQ
ncbi:MAG: PaaI family thioesterase [Bacteroidetes bacterium]|jgi:1,4-dihydroxy-2-naphthoyl-CoA hydrolase|nr:PaaI family thioesterase [Bacteroidota bacterium]